MNPHWKRTGPSYVAMHDHGCGEHPWYYNERALLNAIKNFTRSGDLGHADFFRAGLNLLNQPWTPPTENFPSTVHSVAALASAGGIQTNAADKTIGA